MWSRLTLVLSHLIAGAGDWYTHTQISDLSIAYTIIHCAAKCYLVVICTVPHPSVLCVFNPHPSMLRVFNNNNLHNVLRFFSRISSMLLGICLPTGCFTNIASEVYPESSNCDKSQTPSSAILATTPNF